MGVHFTWLEVSGKTGYQKVEDVFNQVSWSFILNFSQVPDHRDLQKPLP